MTQQTDGHDVWQNGLASSVPPVVNTVLRIDTIAAVTPLDAQIWAFPKKTVPDVLRDTLFGHAELATYAVPDAAKVVNLPELLEDSALEHRCLFKGAAYED